MRRCRTTAIEAHGDCLHRLLAERNRQELGKHLKSDPYVKMWHLFHGEISDCEFAVINSHALACINQHVSLNVLVQLQRQTCKMR